MSASNQSISLDHFQGGLPEAFLAGYHSAVALVRSETTRPAQQLLTLEELEVMLRRQSRVQLRLWRQGY